ncbi:MAG: hypothetical protein ACRDJ9_34680 [Dehalococcoidia bacterium]
MTEQMKTATVRALYGALLTAAASTVAVLQSGTDNETALYAFLATFLSYMIARGAAEGLIDSRRDASGNVTSADVGARDRVSS